MSIQCWKNATFYGFMTNDYYIDGFYEHIVVVSYQWGEVGELGQMCECSFEGV